MSHVGQCIHCSLNTMLHVFFFLELRKLNATRSCVSIKLKIVKEMLAHYRFIICISCQST